MFCFKVLTFHVLSVRAGAADITNNMQVATLQGSNMRLNIYDVATGGFLTSGTETVSCHFDIEHFLV